jgi:hypothetical protein
LRLILKKKNGVNGAMWTVLFEPEFSKWFDELSDDEQDSITAALIVLEQYGHALGRPYVDTIKGSSVSNLKELRIQHKGIPYRAFFAFDPLRQAIILCAGNKQGDKRFYERMIPIAEVVFKRYLTELEEKNHGKKFN